MDAFKLGIIDENGNAIILHHAGSQIYGNDGGLSWCTVSNPARYFSHRRDRVSGRMAACIWLA